MLLLNNLDIYAPFSINLIYIFPVNVILATLFYCHVIFLVIILIKYSNTYSFIIYDIITNKFVHHVTKIPILK